MDDIIARYAEKIRQAQAPQSETAEEVKTYQFENNTGDAVLTVHKVFTGIDLVYNAVHMDTLDLGRRKKGQIIEIHHCREGRIEQTLSDEFFYLMPGDLSIAIWDQGENVCSFPLRHYHGITITVDTELAPKCFSCFLRDVAVYPMTVARRLCGDKRSHILRSQEYIAHIFSELYAVPESIRAGYLKIKVLELFLVLSSIDPVAYEKENAYLSGFQVRIAKEAAAYMEAHMDERITIPELAQRFHISQTHLKQAFKGVYGVPVYSYIRIQKMQAAAQKLIHTELPVLEIANASGYDNGSKFASAFREIMGETPTEYRKAHNKLQNAPG